MLTIKLMVSSKLSWENKLLKGKKPLPVSAVAVSKHKAISYELRSLETSWWSPQNLSETKKVIKKKTTADTSSGFEQAQGHQLWAHKLINKLMVTPKFKWKEKKFINKKTTAGTGVVVSKPRAISYELSCSQSSWWSTQNSHEKKN
jgi:hypothetical protein